MEDAGGQHRIGATLLHAIGEMVEVAHAARGDHRHADAIADGAGEFQIKAGFGAVAVHAGQQDLAGAVLGHLARPGHGIQPHVLATAMAVHIPTRATGRQVVALTPLGIDGHHDALRAVLVRRVADDLRVGNGRRVEADLVGARVEQTANVIDRAHAATDGEGDEDLRRHRLDDVEDQVTPIAGGGDVEEGEFVGALLVVARSDLDRVTGIAQLHEVDAFDDPPARDVQAGDDAFGQHGQQPRLAPGRPKPSGAPAGGSEQSERGGIMTVRRRAFGRQRNPGRRCRWRDRRSRPRRLRFPPRRALRCF